MNSQDAYDRVLAALHRAALDDAHWPAAAALITDAVGSVGNALVVGEGTGDDERIYLARYQHRGETRQDLVREYFDIHYPQDTGIRRLIAWGQREPRAHRRGDGLVRGVALAPGSEHAGLRRVGGAAARVVSVGAVLRVGDRAQLLHGERDLRVADIPRGQGDGRDLRRDRQLEGAGRLECGDPASGRHVGSCGEGGAERRAYQARHLGTRVTLAESLNVNLEASQRQRVGDGAAH